MQWREPSAAAVTPACSSEPPEGGSAAEPRLGGFCQLVRDVGQLLFAGLTGYRLRSSRMVSSSAITSRSFARPAALFDLISASRLINRYSAPNKLTSSDCERTAWKVPTPVNSPSRSISPEVVRSVKFRPLLIVSASNRNGRPTGAPRRYGSNG